MKIVELRYFSEVPFKELKAFILYGKYSACCCKYILAYLKFICDFIFFISLSIKVKVI